MITTGANPKLAIIKSELKNNFGKSAIKGLGCVAGKYLNTPTVDMNKAVTKGYHKIVRGIITEQNKNRQN